MSISLQVKEHISKELNDHLSKLAQLRLPLDALGAELVDQTHERITQEQSAPDGSPWKAWSDGYRAHKTAGAFLDASGELIDSLDYEATDKAVEWGSNMVYAATHQFGDESRNIVARPFLGISKDNEAALLRIAQAQVQAQVDKVAE